MFRFIRLSFTALLMLVCISVAALAQSTVDGAINGVVKDPQGAIVPNATVAVRNVETNKEGTATTDSEGRFRVVQLPPGNYTVTINAAGFGTFTQERVVVEVGNITPVNAGLQVGNVTGETVNVTSDAPVINTAQQDFSTNINQTSINELPINGRRASNFVLLTPATVPDGNFGLISFRGISGLLNNSTVDGGDNNQAFFSEERGRTRINYSISQAAVREFQVNTSNYSAEFGRAAGGVVNTVTKSGTNQFHGSAFFYDRDNKVGARNPLGFVSNFDPNTGSVTRNAFKPEDRRYQFGGTIGGYIVKDKLFFFFSYDQQKRNFPGLAVFSNASFLTTVNRSTATGLSGGLRASNRNLSDAQINSGISFLTSLTGPVPRRGDQTLYLPKIDWNINSSNTFTITYNRLRFASPAGVQTQPTNANAIASFGNDFVRTDSVPLRLTSTLSSTIVNEARFQYSRDFEFQIGQPPSTPEVANNFVRAQNGTVPNVFITGGLQFGTPTFLQRRAYPDERRQQYADTLTISRGKQTIKFGGDFNHVSDLLDNLRNESAAYSYNNINDFIIDYVNATTPGGLRVGGTSSALATCSTSTRLAGRCYTSNFAQAFGPTAFKFSTNDYNFFVQDDYRASSKLTLNLGLRYEYEQLPKPQIPNPLAPGTSVFPSDKNNFGPRVGFAYDLNGNGKSVLRGGYGIYYGRIINSTISNAITNTGAAGSQSQFSISQTSALAPIFPNVLPTAPTASGAVNIVQFSPFAANPRIQEADLIYQREIARNTVASASLLLSFGAQLPRFVDINLNAPTSNGTFIIPATIPSGTFAGQPNGPFAGQTVSVPLFAGARPNTNFGAITEIRSDVTSQYTGLALELNRRLTKGLQFQTSYTLSKAQDSGQLSATFTNTNDPFNVFDLSSERGTSNFDVRHKFVASAVYSPDFFGNDSNSRVGRALFSGFNIAPVVSIYSGVPFNANISGSAPSSGATSFFPGTFPTSGGLNGSSGATRFPLLARNSFRQPKIVNVDLRVSRRFRLREATNIEILAEGFNIFNRTQVTGVNNTFYNTSGNTLIFNPDFGTTNAAGGFLFRERQIQFAARFEF